MGQVALAKLLFIYVIIDVDGLMPCIAYTFRVLCYNAPELMPVSGIKANPRERSRLSVL
jgi:hypothetical protein